MNDVSFTVPTAKDSVNVGAAIDHVYDILDGGKAQDFVDRCGITSLGVLTILSQSDARATVLKFWTSILGKRVVEIGSGVGYLALEMARVAKSVVAIENDPSWSWIFTKFLYRQKPLNLTWIFGHSGSIELSADVAVICSRSGLAEMIAEARRLAPVIVLISCAEVLVCDREDTDLDIVADYTKQRIAELFGEAEDALHHPEKRAAYEAMTGGGPVEWDKVAAEWRTADA